MADPHLDVVDNPIERLELLAGDEEAIASFLDQIDVTGPRDREMLGELARTQTLADHERFPSAHRRAVGALETLARHGYHGSSAASLAGPAKNVVRWLIQLVARYVVVSYLRQTALDMRNLYWLREIETGPPSPQRADIGRARYDAEALVGIFKRREIWRTVGHCGRPPRDQSRKLAVIAISLTVGAWVVLPAAVAIAFTS